MADDDEKYVTHDLTNMGYPGVSCLNIKKKKHTYYLVVGGMLLKTGHLFHVREKKLLTWWCAERENAPEGGLEFFFSKKKMAGKSKKN